MMQAVATQTFYVKHIQRAAFDVPVFCEPLWVRLHPRSESGVYARSVRLDVTPRPARIHLATDLAGNPGWRVEFGELCVGLSLSVTSCIERQASPPSAFLQPAASTNSLGRSETYGWNYEGHDQSLLRYYSTTNEDDPDSLQLVEQMLDRSQGSPASFLACLAAEMRSQYRWEAAMRPGNHGRIWRPDGIRSRAAWLASLRREPIPGRPGGSPRRRALEQFVAAARLARIPTRYARGYCAIDSDEIEHDMMIWTECYLTGSGWVGFDPCRGTVTDANYLPVAVGRDLGDLATVVGEYRGSERQPEWQTQIILRQGPAGEQHSVLPSDMVSTRMRAEP